MHDLISTFQPTIHPSPREWRQDRAVDQRVDVDWAFWHPRAIALPAAGPSEEEI